jgi:hypothetical protein
MKYSLNDISIVPASVSNIDSRSECDPFHVNGKLPLFTAPMSSVVDLNNFKLFEENGIIPILPRTVNITDRMDNIQNGTWCAFSLSEFDALVNSFELLIEEWDVKIKSPSNGLHILVDIANGNMLKLHDLIRRIKKTKHANKIKIMAGNVANPETYRLLSEAGADYIRVGIGGGSVCITSSNTGVHYPLGSLIKECFDISTTLDSPAYIVADGGIKGYSDIVKCLALGADYVMCGSIFNKMLESAGETKNRKYGETNLQVDLNPFNTVNQYSTEALVGLKNGVDLVKIHYGMSTKKAQKELGSENLKTSEGIIRYNKVEYTMSQWVENFMDYLKSTMSYTSSKGLYDFIGKVETVIISNNSYNSINR